MSKLPLTQGGSLITFLRCAIWLESLLT